MKTRPLDAPANTNGATAIPTMEEIDGRLFDNEEGPFDQLVLMLVLDHEVKVLDEARVLAFTKRELREVVLWLGLRHLSASDHIIRKKRLEQPACCVGALGVPS